MASPLHDAWRRLRRNIAAMVSLVVVALVSAITAISPWIAPYDPDIDATHVGAVPPGTVVPDVGSANRIALGEPVVLGWSPITDGTLTAVVLEHDPTRYRIVFSTRRPGQVRGIQRQPGGAAMAELDLANLPPLVQELPDGTTRAVPESGVFARRATAPDALAELAVDHVLNLRPLATGTPVTWGAVIADGVVQELTREGLPTTARAITPAGEDTDGTGGADLLRGNEVVSVALDERPLERTHYLGTDRNGRDFLTRVLYGGQISLLVGVIATAVSLVIGVIYGAVSGWIGGRGDRLLMGAVDVLYALPFMFLVIILLATFGRHIVILFAALGAVQWLTMARIVRGEILSLRQREFVAAAQLAGAPGRTILLRHLVPNCAGPVIIYTTLTVPIVILEESFLAFLGLQVEFGGRTLDSWGSLIRAGVQANGQTFNQSWLLFWPSLAMAVTLLGLNILGDGLRDALDPKLRGRQ